jgi:hypothetical protein
MRDKCVEQKEVRTAYSSHEDLRHRKLSGKQESKAGRELGSLPVVERGKPAMRSQAVREKFALYEKSVEREQQDRQRL